jgi:hypothetical protein
VKRAALAVASRTVAEFTALADLPPSIDQIGFWNPLHQLFAMRSGRHVNTHDSIPRAVRQIAFVVVVALLFVIGGFVQTAVTNSAMTASVVQ